MLVQNNDLQLSYGTRGLALTAHLSACWVRCYDANLAGARMAVSTVVKLDGVMVITLCAQARLTLQLQMQISTRSGRLAGGKEAKDSGGVSPHTECDQPVSNQDLSGRNYETG